jgi:hypothetical protein
MTNLVITNKKSIVYVILHNYIVEIQLCNNNSFFLFDHVNNIFFFQLTFSEKKINHAGGIPAMLRNIYFIICNKAG